MQGMRFYLFDGKTVQGPLELEEVTKKPDFGAESLVCPVGPETSNDWKPALTFAVLRELLLTPPPAAPAPCPAPGNTIFVR